METGKYCTLKHLVLLLLVLVVTSFSQAQVTRDWTRSFDLSFYGSAIELRDGKYLVSLATDNTVYLIVTPNGNIIDNYSYVDYEDSGINLEQVGKDSIIVNMYNSVSFALISRNSGYHWASESYTGGMSSVHSYIDGYISCGTHTIDQTLKNAVITRYNNEGNIIWHNEYEETGIQSTRDVSKCVTNSIYAIITDGTVMHLKVLDINGNQIDQISYQGEWVMSSQDMNFMPDGNIFVRGSFYFNAERPSLCMLLSSDGDLLEAWVAPDVEDTYSIEIWQLPDGGYLSTRVVDLDGFPYYELQFVRYDAAWNELWQYNEWDINGTYFLINSFTGMITSDCSFILYGQFEESWNEYNALLIKYNLSPADLGIALEPYGNLNSISAPSRFFWHGTLTNNTDADITTDVWVIVRGPDGYPSEPLRVWEDITVPANSTYEADLRQNVPADAASGEYNYIVRAGTYEPGNPQHTIQAYFPLAVTGGTEANLDPPRTRGVVAAPFEGPEMVELAPEMKTMD